MMRSMDQKEKPNKDLMAPPTTTPPPRPPPVQRRGQELVHSWRDPGAVVLMAEGGDAASKPSWATPSVSITWAKGG